MRRILVSTVVLLVGGALATAGCSTFSGPAPAAETYGSHFGVTGPSGTPGELPPGVTSSGD